MSLKFIAVLCSGAAELGPFGGRRFVLLWSPEDTRGVAFAIAINMGPIAALTWFYDSMSKQPIGASAFALPCGVALLGAVISSAMAYKLGRGKHDHFDYYVLFGSLSAFVLVVTYCLLGFAVGQVRQLIQSEQVAAAVTAATA